MSAICFKSLRNSLPTAVDDQFIHDYLELCEIVEIEKNKTFIEAETIESGVFFLVKGSLTKNVLTSDNELRTVMFHTDTFFNFMVCSDSYMSGEPTAYSFITNEDCLILKIKYEDFRNCLDKCLPFLKWYSFYHETTWTYFETTRDKYLSLTSEEYLQWLYKNFPFLFQVFPSKNIASFMGITPVWFSNLKRKWLS